MHATEFGTVRKLAEVFEFTQFFFSTEKTHKKKKTFRCLLGTVQPEAEITWVEGYSTTP